MDTKLKNEGKTPHRYQIVKQADVLLGLYLRGEQDPEILKANYAYYAVRTSHGSSLSDSIHAIMAIRAGDMDRAWEHFQKAINVDLADTKENNHYGTHAAAMGGAWQALINGFGGVHSYDDRILFNPKLPAQLDSLEFNVRHWGQKIHARAQADRLYLFLPYSGKSVSTRVEVEGILYDLMPGEERSFSLAPESEYNGHNRNFF